MNERVSSIKGILKNLYDFYPEYESTDFIVGKDSFEDVIIDSTSIERFWYFKNNKKGLIKRFVLSETQQIQKACVVTLIKGKNGKFLPRFDFQIWNVTKKAFIEFSKDNPDQNLIKAKVSFDNCAPQFFQLLDFIKNIQQIDFSSTSYAVVDSSKKDIFENFDKLSAINALRTKYGSDISDKDISLLLNRKSKLDYFGKLLSDPDFFKDEQYKMGANTKTENVWQNFFEDNSWIFGYGLQLVSCEGLDNRKLEQTVVGNDIVDGPGKRIDALLKTKGLISKVLFCEIKTHLPDLLVEPYDRPGVFVPAKELRGAVAQIQKTIHKVTLKMQENYIRPHDSNGDPSGEEILFVKPRGVVVIGMLSDFKLENGINYEKLSSFEIYRQQVSGIEIMTYDELYQRAKFIVDNH